MSEQGFEDEKGIWRAAGWKPEPETKARGAARPGARRRPVRDATKREAARARWALLNAFVDEGMAGLELSDVATWLALYRHARADGGAVVARAQLARLVGCSERTITKTLARLVRAGWLVRLRRGGPTGGAAVHRVQKPDAESTDGAASLGETNGT